MNAKQIFQEAHRVARKTLKGTNGNYNYRSTFSMALKAIYSGIKKKQASILYEANWQKETFPHIFTKSIEEMTTSKLNCKHLISTVAHGIISNLPHVKSELKKRERKAFEYYKSTGGHITMC